MRCFSDYQVAISAPYVLIAGANGSGKTSLFEALHYACYLRSFRTHVPRELVRFDQSHFFIKLTVEHEGSEHEVQVGFSHRKKLVKIDQQSVESYKQLVQYYRIITLTQDDLMLIKDGPDERRLFMDQAVLLEQPEKAKELKKLKLVVQNRNAILQRTERQIDDSYLVWTKQLFDLSMVLESVRRTLLADIQQHFAVLAQHYGAHFPVIELSYRAKSSVYGQSFDVWFEKHRAYAMQEYALGRSLFGAHLDDLEIRFQGQPAKHFASRGQQKLILVLLKLAQLEQLKRVQGPAILLIDDFMNDFDEPTARRLLQLIRHLACQTFFTSPQEVGFFEKLLSSHDCQRIQIETDRPLSGEASSIVTDEQVVAGAL